MTTAAITAFAASLVFVPLMRRLAQRIGWVSAPRSDRWSRKPVALCGGLAIFAAFLLSALSARPPGTVWAGLLGPAAAMCLLGWADDILGFKPYTKFVGQVIIASAAVYAGSAFRVFPWVPLNVIASVFWIVAVTNAFNLLDNMDGLSAGIGIIAAGFLAALLLQEGRSEAAVLAVSLGGALAGFLFYNFHPASIFMGDSGSLFIGFLLATLSLGTSSFPGTLGAAIIPALVLSVPLMDMSFVSVTRILRGRSIAHGGRDHTSHRLVSLGLSERSAVLTLYLLGTVSGGAAWWVSRTPEIAFIIIPLLLVALAVVAIYLFDMTGLSTEDLRGAQSRPLATTLMFQLSFKRRIFEICLDLVLIVACYSLAYLLRFDFDVPGDILIQLNRSLPLVIMITLGCLYSARLYHGIWRFTSVRDVPRFFGASASAVLINVLAMVLIYRFDSTPRSVFPLYGLLLFVTICVTRYSFRLIGLAVFSLRRADVPEIPIVIGGAGEDGVSALREIRSQNGRWNWKPVGFVDSDSHKRRMRIHGVPVLGGWGDLPRIHARHPFQALILSADAPAESQLQEALRFCREGGIAVKRFRWVCEDLAP